MDKVWDEWQRLYVEWRYRFERDFWDYTICLEKQVTADSPDDVPWIDLGGEG